MALEEYAGAIVMEVNGTEVEIVSLDVSKKTGRRVVKTMNRTGRPRGFSRGVQEIDLRVTAVIPLTGDMDWVAIEGAKITINPIGGGKRTSYLDCIVIEAGEKYVVDGEAVRDLTMAAMRDVEE